MSTAGPRAIHFQRSSNQQLLGMLPLTVQQACGRRAAHLHASASNQEIPAEGIPRRRGIPRGRSFPVQNVAAPPDVSSRGLDVAVHRSLGEGIRGDFPILHQEVNGKPLIYLDSGATSQKPEAVLRAMDDYNRGYNSNVHRGVHHLAAKATTAYEAAREKIAHFIGASPREIVFTKNASEAINLVAHAWGTHNLKAGDEVIVSVAEHHSNLVPWQLLCERTGASLRAVPLTPDRQEIDIGKLREMLSPRTKIVALVHVSNMLGAILDVGLVAEAVHKVGAKLLLDCCQAVPNLPIQVHSLGADWIVASGHKMCGPTGIGFLWGRYDLLDSMKPFLGGGEMIEHVAIERSTYAPPPSRFEAGTPPIAEAIGLGAAVDYLSGFGMDSVRSYECDIGEYLYERLSAVKGVTIYGPPPSRGRAALCTFNVEGLHATDVSTLLDQAGIAIRSGHHCTQPLHTYLGISASARASPYIYNTPAEVDSFVEELQDTINFFADVG